MKYFPIEKFGTKLMVASKSLNKIPSEYLSYAENARIYDGGIGPRKGKQIFITSGVGKNKGGFVMQNKIYQVTEGKIYEITNGSQVEKTSLGYDARIDTLVYGNFTMIASDGQSLKVFDGTTTTQPATVPTNSGILEYCRGYSFITKDNILYISRPITPANPQYAYDFTGTGSQNITFDSPIKGLKRTMNGLYIFTEKTIEFLGANSLQNVAGAAAFISTPLGEGGELIENQLITASGDKIFYITKNLQINTINYVSGTAYPGLGELSSRAIIGIKELLNGIDVDQPYGFAFVNDSDTTVQFHLRRVNSPINNIVIIYDLINDTWCIDTGKNYNFILSYGEKFYGFSDINSNVYEDNVGNSDNTTAINFLIKTQNLTNGTLLQKIYGGFFTQGAINRLTDLNYRVFIDNEEIFTDNIVGQGVTGDLDYIGELSGDALGNDLIGGEISFNSILSPFDLEADVGRIYQGGIRIRIEVNCKTQIQDFLIDTLGIIAEPTNFNDIKNKL